MLQKFDWSNQTFQKQFKQRILRKRERIPDFLLGVFWKRLLLSKAEAAVSSEEYHELLSSERFKFESEIKRDINRTFPELKFFKEKDSYGQIELFNVLKAFSIYDPEVGYCQGMGFITGILLSFMSELDVFNCLVVLMNDDPDSEYKMSGLYKPGLPLLSKHLGDFQNMIEAELPELARHFQNHGIEISMFGSQWILSLFIYNLQFPKSVGLFTLFLLFNYRVILLFGIFVLEEMESDLLEMGFEEILCRINNIDELVSDIDDFVQWLEDDGGWEVGITRTTDSNDSRNPRTKSVT